MIILEYANGVRATFHSNCVSARYEGVVSVELEDENFNTDEESEKAGLTHSLNFLQGI